MTLNTRLETVSRIAWWIMHEPGLDAEVDPTWKEREALRVGSFTQPPNLAEYDAVDTPGDDSAVMDDPEPAPDDEEGDDQACGAKRENSLLTNDTTASNRTFVACPPSLELYWSAPRCVPGLHGSTHFDRLTEFSRSRESPLASPAVVAEFSQESARDVPCCFPLAPA